MQAWYLCVLTTTARAMMKISHENRREEKVENVISISGRRDGEMSTARSCILCEIECENPLRHRSHISFRLRPTVENEKKNSFSAPCVRSLEYFPFSSFY